MSYRNFVWQCTIGLTRVILNHNRKRTLLLFNIIICIWNTPIQALLYMCVSWKQKRKEKKENLAFNRMLTRKTFSLTRLFVVKLIYSKWAFESNERVAKVFDEFYSFPFYKKEADTSVVHITLNDFLYTFIILQRVEGRTLTLIRKVSNLPKLFINDSGNHLKS